MPRTLSLSNLLNDNKDVWVRNVHKPRGVIVLSLIDRSGRTQREIIPNTKLPINLNSRIDPDTIKHSRDLRRLVDDGVLDLVDEKEALQIYEDPSKKEELKAAFEQATGKHMDVNKVRGLNRNAKGEDQEEETNIQGLAVVAGDANEIQQKLKMSAIDDIVDAIDEDEDPGVQSKVKTLIAQLSANPPEIKNREAKYQLTSLDLTKEDLYYIISNTSVGVVNKYAKEQLAALTGETVDALDLPTDDDE